MTTKQQISSGQISSSGSTNNQILVSNGTAINWSSSFPGTANDSTYAYGKSESALNVNSALTSNNSSYLGGTAAAGYQTTAGLSANVATLTANNTSFVGSVSAANVVSNAQLSANLSNYQTTAGLSANVATLAANSATYLGDAGNLGNSSGIYVSGTVNAAVHSVGSSFIVNTSQITISTIPLSANGGLGTSGQVLTSNGSTGAPYWSTVSGGGGFTNGQSISVNNFVITGAFTANSSNGSAGQVLTSNGTATYWSTVSGGGGSVNTDAQYTWTNVQTFSANVSLGAALLANGSMGTSGQFLTSNGTTTYWSTAGVAAARVSSTTSISSPLSFNSDSYDLYAATAQAGALTINADAGTPVDGRRIMFRFKDNGTAQTLSFTTGVSKGFRAVGVSLPTTTVVSKILYVGCIYNAADSRWDVIATGQEA